jgi:ABC-type nitrate/sulfonate/bicarbonate transport system substrate-binding protein
MRQLRHALRASAAAAVAVATAATLAACAGAEAASPHASGGRTVLRYQGSTGQVGFPELAEDLGYFHEVTLDWIGDVTGGPASIQAAVTGQTDFGGAFNGAIAKLASTGAKVTSVISYYGADELTHGGFYTLAGSPVHDAHDLVGKKIGVNTLGAQSEFVIREWLARGGLTPDEVDKVQLVVVPPVNAEQVLRAGQVDVAALSGVLQDKALARGGLTRLFGEDSLFGDFAYGSLIFRDDFVAQHRDAVADFVQGVARAIRWTQVTPPDEVRARYADIITKRGRGENADLVQYWKSSSLPTPGGVIQPQEISIWVDWLVRNGELEKGKLDPKKLYTNEFNPYSNGTYPADAGPDGEPVPTSAGSTPASPPADGAVSTPAVTR